MNDFKNIVNKLLYEEKNLINADKKDPKDLSTFVKKRSAGAKKIETSAFDKGGYSSLTGIHFKAKEMPYRDCAKHVDDENSQFIKEKADECFDKLKHWHKMSQREFQHVMGQLEAYGEFYIRSLEIKGS